MKETFRNVGVICFYLFVVNCSYAQKRWVYDNESVLTQLQINKLDSLFDVHEKKTTNEIVLVTTKDFGTDTSIRFYSVNLYRNLGVGKKDKNNGVLIVYSGEKRQTRITTGYGTELVLTDGKAQKIIGESMIPHFKKGNTFEGLWEGSKAIVTFLERPENKID
jgi:uncharacterized protein